MFHIERHIFDNQSFEIVSDAFSHAFQNLKIRVFQPQFPASEDLASSKISSKIFNSQAWK